MKKIGITGGVGAGKTAILNYIAEKYDSYICKADEVAHDVEQKGEECYKELLDNFGSEILDADGNIDRDSFAEVIFSDNETLQAANDIIHPAVKKRILSLIQEQERKGTKYFILEAALLIEDGYKKILDEMWYIHASENIRRKRLIDSRGYSESKIDSIMMNQMREDEYRVNCDRIIVNNGDLQNAYSQIDELLGAK